jgi:hypothetical protein
MIVRRVGWKRERGLKRSLRCVMLCRDCYDDTGTTQAQRNLRESERVEGLSISIPSVAADTRGSAFELVFQKRFIDISVCRRKRIQNLKVEEQRGGSELSVSRIFANRISCLNVRCVSV